MGWLNLFNIGSNSEQRSADDIGANDEIERAVNTVLLENERADNAPYLDVSENGSLSLAAVWACVRILSETVGSLPIHLYKRADDGRQRLSRHELSQLLLAPNDYSDRMSLMQTLIMHVMLWGNGYLRIYRNRLTMRPVELEILDPATTQPYLTKTRKLFFRTAEGEILASDDVIHIKNLSTNGIKGKSPIAIHRENLMLSRAAQSFGEQLFSKGCNPTGVFTYPSTLKTDRYEQLKRDLRAQYAGLNNAHAPMLLEGGLKFERISIPPEDAQFIATREFQKTEIATIFGVPPHMIADLERATNNNIEHQGMEFVTYCLMPYIVRIEQQFNQKLLRYDEQSDMYFKFNLAALLRGDMKTRTESYRNLYYIGAMNANEARALEDMNKYEGGDEFYTQSNMQKINAKTENNE